MPTMDVAPTPSPAPEAGRRLQPSPDLLAANERLQALQARAQVTRPERPPAAIHSAAAATRPGQTSRELANGQKLLMAYRRRDGVESSQRAAGGRQGGEADGGAAGSTGSAEELTPIPLVVAEPPETPPSIKETVKHYPSLGAAVLKAGQVPCYRLWLAGRLLDETGRGWLRIDVVTGQLTSQGAPLRLCGRRRLRQTLQAGEGRFWRRDNQGRLWLVGTAQLAAALGVDRLAGRPVELPVAALTGGVGVFKAHLYAAWHSGRKQANPISRQTQEALMGVPARTQRHYDQVAGVSSKRNLAVGDKYDEEVMEQRAWQRGRAVFEFVDVQGRQGPKDRHYVAWRLPNSYQGPHRQAARGRQRKVNRRLKDLVNERAQGNGSQKVGRLFYRDGTEAGRAFNRRSGSEAYWPALELPAGQVVWGVFLRR
ncbi:MAG: hypothetical protein L0332_28325 [Chloroflexi bacterium]|nr:hypothetical protein [Chloroflexota bacterium]MCI0730604.1 hypothetical protein [Chloroflexota bacterium]